MSRQFFDQVADALVGMVPADLGPCGTRFTSVNLKLWFGAEGREHYEAQFLRNGKVEVGFHTEHRAAERNEAVLDRFRSVEAQWRPILGDDAVAGEFVGAKGSPWRRLSEVVPVAHPLDLDAAIDLATRLATFAAVLEPLRTAPSPTPTPTPAPDPSPALRS